MPRPRRIAPAGVCFHVLNRGNNRQALFRKPADYAAFVAILAEADGRFEIDLFCWCLMPNHWHLVVRPRTDTALSRFMAWITLTHARRHHGHYPSFSGHLYQGRFKSFPVQTDDYFLMLCRYVESNPLRAKLATRARDWPWSSRHPSTNTARRPRPAGSPLPLTSPLLASWPVDRPGNWSRLIDESMVKADCQRVESSLRRESPLGSDRWSRREAARLQIDSTLNPRGRPRQPVETLSQRQQRRRAKEQ